MNHLFRSESRPSATPTPPLILLSALSLAILGCGAGDDAAEGEEEALTEDIEVPAAFRVRLETSEGDIVFAINRALSPNGADRFHELVRAGFYDDVRFFRVDQNFVAQFGMSGDPETNARWRERRIMDDPVAASNTRGTLTFATSGLNSRTTQLFINLVDNSRLDTLGFSPFGEVDEGMDVVDRIFDGYGAGPGGPNQARIHSEGNAYLDENFPELTRIIRAQILP